MPVTRTERRRLEIELALAKSRLETLNRLVLLSEIDEVITSLRNDIQTQHNLISEIEAKLKER